MKNAATYINATSGEVEYYTPPFILEAARNVFYGPIELDPASSEAANNGVRALKWFGIKDDGLSQDWKCQTLWMNHPFGRGRNRPWISKLLLEYTLRGFHALCITYACTSEAWFAPLMEYPQCFLVPRTNYLLPDGSVKRGVTKGSVVTYLGPDLSRFNKNFKDLGVVKVRP